MTLAPLLGRRAVITTNTRTCRSRFSGRSGEVRKCRPIAAFGFDAALWHYRLTADSTLTDGPPADPLLRRYTCIKNAILLYLLEIPPLQAFSGQLHSNCMAAIGTG